MARRTPGGPGWICLLLGTVPGCGEPEPAPAPSPPSSPLTAECFVERTDRGLDFVHHRYTTENIKYLPETAGSGVAVLDHDGDGDLDVYLVQGVPLPGYTGDVPAARNKLYRNEGGLQFRDVTEAAGVGDDGYGMGASCPDIDNDGFPDLYVTNVRANVLYRNRGDGTFEDVTAGSGLGDEAWSTAAGWFDYDRDGDLDLYLANYAVCDFDAYEVCRQNGLVSYCHPDMLAASPDRLFRNEGDFRFVEVTAEAGIVDLLGKGLAVVPFDHDDDGWVDLFVANDSNENYLWRNRRDGTFEEIAGLVGVAVNAKGSSQACMGTDIADVDGDLDFDIFAANFGKESNVLYIRVDDEFYEDHVARSGMGESSYFMTGFGSEFFDFDRDGDQDLMVVNGHIIDVVEQLDPSQTFEQLPQFFVNRGGGVFEEAGERLGAYFTRRNLGRGMAVADLDNDGDLDVVVNNNDHAAALLENRSPDGNHWIGFRLVGTTSPRDAIGARVVLEAAGGSQVEEVRGTSSYLSFQDLRLFFGLGSHAEPCRASIRWPSGMTQSVSDLEVDRYHTIREKRSP